MIKSTGALILGLILGFAAGLFIGVAPWAALGQPSRIRVVNMTTVALTDVRLQIGSGEQVLERVAPHGESAVRVELEAAVPLSISFTCAESRRQITAGDLQPFGDDRTITVLNTGRTVIVTHGSAAAVVESTPVESTPVESTGER